MNHYATLEAMYVNAGSTLRVGHELVAHGSGTFVRATTPLDERVGYG